MSGLRGLRFAFQLLGLVVRDERVDDGLQAAFQNQVELVQRKADAVAGEAVLREVLGADLLAAVAGAHRLLALADQFGLLLFHLHSYGISCTFITRLAIVSSPFSSI